jgi:hypothetical protein
MGKSFIKTHSRDLGSIGDNSPSHSLRPEQEGLGVMDDWSANKKLRI